MSDTATDLRDKFKTIDRLLYKYEYVFVHVNSGTEGTALPAHLSGQASVTLKLSRLFRGALHVSEDKISAELLFSGEYFTCQLPMNSIWGVATPDSANMVWPESAPAEVIKSLQAQEDELKPEETNPLAGASPPPAKGRPQLRRVK